MQPHYELGLKSSNGEKWGKDLGGLYVMLPPTLVTTVPIKTDAACFFLMYSRAWHEGMSFPMPTFPIEGASYQIC